MNTSASEHLCNNFHLHYYGTFLAARLAGMPPSDAWRLALFCRSMVELKAGGWAVEPWHFQGLTFSPCVTGCIVADGEYGPQNCELAFQRLPALDFDTATGVATYPSVNANDAARQEVGQNLRHNYHPLTDVDWQGGGHFKPSFARKIAQRLALVRFGANTVQQQALSDDSGLLRCQANSHFARVMLNDTLYHSRYCDNLKAIDLALLGCRLYVYQNTWLNQVEPGGEVSSRQTRDEVLLEAFYWSVYAIECFVKGTSMGDKLKFNRCAKPEFAASLSLLLGFNGDGLEGEYLWLERLPLLLSESMTDIGHRWQGFRYRPYYLVEQAMLTSGSGLSRHIQLLSNFKQTGFFQLNKAVEYHCRWLFEQLCQRGFNHLNTSQYCSEADVFTL